LTKLVRSVIVHADPSFCYAVEIARRTDGVHPARDFLDDLEKGMLDGDPDTEDLPDEEQIRDYPRLIDVIRGIATYGEPAHRRQVNYLEDGLWEFKYGRKRLAFFDTDGRGNHVPKPPQDIFTSTNVGSDYFWFPDFDPILRITNGWVKTDDAAPPEAIELAKLIREEDLEHDKP
jgi:hypothetical protein